jgi:uncharacterized protein
MPSIDHDEIARLTEEYGGSWGVNHALRLLHLISLIAEGQEYDHEVVWLAAYLHDWGGYPAWQQPGVDHALRSRQVIQEYLAGKGLPADQLEKVLECIEFHHAGGEGRSLEAILLADADALDFMGMVGVWREAAMKPKDLRKAYESILNRREKLNKVIRLEKTKEIAAARLQETEMLLTAFQEETFGYF